MPNYSDQIYNYILKLDPTYKNDVSIQLFKSKMANASYSKKIYDWIGTADPTFKGDVSFDAFNTKLGYPKKKVTTVSPSGGGTKPSSSASLSKAVSAGVQKAVESIIKPDGSYRYPGREDALYKKTKNQWYIDLGKTGNYTKVSEKSRVAALEKYAKAYTPVKTKEFTTVKSTVPQGVSQKINKEMTESLVDAAKILAGEKKPKAEKYEEPETFKAPGKDNKEYQLVYSESGVPIWNESVIQYQNGKPLTWNNGKGKTGYVYDYKQVTDPKRVATLNKMYNKTASSSNIEQTYVGYPGKDDVEYRVNIDKKTNEPYWEKRPKGYNDFFRITAKGSIDALNAQFNKEIKYDAARDKFSGVAEDIELIKKKEFDTNLLSVNTALVGNNEDVVIKKLKDKFPTFEFKRTYGSVQEMLGDFIEVRSPDGKNNIKVSLDNWTDATDSQEAKRLRNFIRVNASQDLAESSKSLDVAEKENDTRVGVNFKSRRAVPGDPEYDINRPPDQQPLVTRTSYVTKEEKAKTEEKERLARKDYARESYLNLRDVYYRQKKAIETGKNPYDDKEVENIIAYLPNDKETLTNASKFADDINKSFKDYNGKMKLLQIYADDANERIRSGKISEEEFNEQYKPKMEQLQAEIQQMGVDLKEETKYLGTITKSADESIAAEYIVNEARGTFLGGVSKKFVKGLTALPRLGMMTKKEQEGIVKFITGDYTTEEYMNSKNRSDVTKAIFSLGESLGALATGAVLGGGPAMYASFFAQSYTEMKDELDMIKDPSGAGPSESAKVLMAGTYGVVSSILEKFGLDLALQKTGLGRQLTHAVIKDAFIDIPENASKEFVQAAIINSTKKMFATLPVNALIGGTGEGVTEMTQALSKIGIQEVYDGMAGSDYFNNKTAREIYADVLYEGYLGALGGGIMSTVSTAGTITGNEFRQKMNKEQLEVLMNAAKMENIDRALLTNLKAGIISGKYTKEESKQIYDNFREVQGRINSMPDEMSVEDKSVALDLMTEKANLEKAIANKDESLTAPQRKRIAEINVELIKISENAVQKQTTSEVSVQPEAAVGGEVAQGVSQAEPQVATQEVGQDVRKEDEKVDTLIEDRISNYDLQPVDLFEDMTEADNNIIERASKGEAVDVNALNGTIDYIYAKYKEITQLKKDGQQRLEKSTTIKYLDDILSNLDNDLDFLMTYKQEVEQGNAPISLEQFNTTIKPATATTAVEPTVEAQQTAVAQPSAKQTATETIDVYHGGSLDEKTGDIYVTEDKNQATEYAKGNEGQVIKYSIDKNKVASENDIYEAISELGIEIDDESKIFELIDPRFEETYIGDENKQKLFNILEEKGFESASFIDEDLSLRNKGGVKNIVVFNAEKLLPSSVTVNENQADNLYDQGYRPVINGDVQSDYIKENIGDLFEQSERIEMALPAETIAAEVTPVQPTEATVTPVAETQPAEAQPITEEQPTEAQPVAEEVVAEEEMAPEEEVVAEEEVAPEEKPRTKEDIDADVAKMDELFGKTPPKFKKEKQEPQNAIEAGDVEEITDEMNQLPEEVADFDVPSDLTTKNKTNIKSLISRFGNKLKAAWKGGIIKDISEFNGVPFTFTISDQLSSGPVTNPFTGSTIDLNGGLGFNLTEGNENNAWANTDLKSSKDTYRRALEVYNANKSLFERLWSEGKLPNGHVPMAVVKMGQDSIKTNEALFRLASDTIKSKFSARERANSLKGLIEDIGNSAVTAENNRRQKNGEAKLTEKEANKIYKDAVQSNKVVAFIRENNFKTIDELLDNMSSLKPIGERATVTKFLFTGGIELDKETKPGIPRSKSGLALVGNKGDAFYKYIHLQTLNNIIQEEATSKIPTNHVIAIVGVDVLNGGVTSAAKGEVVHGNYPYGLKGQLIGVLENPIHAVDIFPEMYSKVFAMLKPKKGGDLPSAAETVSQSVAVSGAIASTKAFKGAKLAEKMTNLQKLIAKLKLAFPTITIVDTQQEFDEALQDPNVKQFVKDGEVVYGFTTDGKIFLNPDKANSNTAIHEFAHIWMNFLKLNNPGLLQKGFDLLEGTSILKQKIKELGDNELAREEAMADLIASRGELLVEAGARSKFKSWLNAVFNYVKSKFKAFETLSPEQFQKLTLNQFVDGSLASLLSGKEITSNQIKSLQVLFSKQNDIDYIVATARANNIQDDAIEVYLRNNGFSDADIIQAMTQMKPARDIDVKKIYKLSQDALKRKFDANAIARAFRFTYKILFERQNAIKNLIRGIKNKDAKRAFDKIVTKAGATGQASYRFKRADRKIYGGLSSDLMVALNEMIYARRIIDINTARREKGKPPYTGIDGYNIANAMVDLNRLRNELDEKTYEDLNRRAALYFAEFSESLKRLYESGRITEATYLNFKDREYSPIKTIKYIIGENTNPDNADRQAATLGVSRKDINQLSDKNDNPILMDSRWLLMMNMHTVAAREFENRMLNNWAEAMDNTTQEEKDAMSQYIKENPIVRTTKDGRPVQKYELSDFGKKAELVGFTPITYFKDGQQRIMVVNDMYANQILDIKNSKLINSMRIAGILTGVPVLRFMATVGNAVFILGNVPIDIMNATFSTNVYSWFKPLALVQATTGFSRKFIRSIYDDIRYLMNEDYENSEQREFIEHGGAMDFLSQDGIVGIKQRLSQSAIRSYLTKPFIVIGATTSYLGAKSEFGMRVAVYSKQKRNLIAKYKKDNNGKAPTGQDLDDIMWAATREARQLIDFSQGGSAVKAIDPILPYLNAATQGLRKPFQFAKENPGAFALNMTQIAIGAGIMSYHSMVMALAAIPGEDDEEKLRKLKDTLDSIPQHTKAMFHIHFTGEKDKDGNFKYIKIKKLPFISILTTIMEEYAYQAFFKEHGGTYDVNTALMWETVKKSMPIWPTELAGKNPGAAAFMALAYNKDTFTGKDIFTQPRDKKIKEQYQGKYDDKVEDFFKVITDNLPFGISMSPKKLKVALEKIITSPSTNPMVHVGYCAMNGLFSKKQPFYEDLKVCGEMIAKSVSEKMVKYTDPDILNFVREDRMKAMETEIESEIWRKEQEVYNKIDKVYDSGKELTTGELIDIVKNNFDEADHEKYAKKYYTYIQNRNTNKGMLDILYERVPESQAYKLYMEFGPKISEDEMKYLNEVMELSGQNLSKKAYAIYLQKYSKK